METQTGKLERCKILVSGLMRGEYFLLVQLGLIIIFSTFFFSYAFYTASTNHYPSLLEIWNRWDGPHYISLAENWYQNSGENNLFIVFFPFYPSLIKVASLVFKNYILSALIVSNAAYILVCIFLYKLVKMDFSKDIALRSIFYLSIFPTAYFLHAGYTESLFLALAVASLYYSRKSSWLVSGILGMFTALTRITGIILLPVLLFEYLSQKEFKIKNIKLNILWLAFPIFGFLLYLTLNYAYYGDPFKFLKILEEYWFKKPAFPWQGFWTAIRGFGWRGPSAAITIAGAESFFVLLAAALTIFAFKYLRFSYGLYSLLTLIAVTSSSFWLSMPRYVLTLFPIFIVLAIWGKNKSVNFAITVSSLMLYSLFLSLFVSGQWAF